MVVVQFEFLAPCARSKVMPHSVRAKEAQTEGQAQDSEATAEGRLQSGRLPSNATSDQRRLEQPILDRFSIDKRSLVS